MLSRYPVQRLVRKSLIALLALSVAFGSLIAGLTKLRANAAASVTLVDNCDRNNGWVPELGAVSVDTATQQQGTGAVVLNGATQTWLKMRKNFTEPVDLSGIATRGGQAVTFWLKVTDVSKIKEIHVDFSDPSGLLPDGTVNWDNPSMRRWVFGAGNFGSGQWAKLQITANDPNIFAADGWRLPDYSRISSISVWAVLKEDNVFTEISVDNFKVEAVAASPPVTLTDNCDSNNGWIPELGAVSVDTAAPKQGAGAVVLSGAAQTWLKMRKNFTEPVDLSGITTANTNAVTFWLKVTDVSKIKEIHVDFSDPSGLLPNGTVNWDSPSLRRWVFSAGLFEDGQWAKLQITANDPNIFAADGWRLPDYTRISSISVWAVLQEDDVFTEIAVDDFKVESYEEGASLKIQDDCDSMRGWMSSLGSGKLDTVNPKQGKASIMMFGNPEEALRLIKKLPVPDSILGIDVKECRELTLWVRVSDTSKMRSLEIDLVDPNGLDSNGNRSWTNSKRWVFESSQFRSGEWVQLTLTGLDENIIDEWKNSAFDYDHIAMFWIQAYVANKGDYLEVSMDDIRLNDLPYPPETESDLNNNYIPMEDDTKPEIIDSSAAARLKYKMIVAPHTAVDQLLASLKIGADYSACVLRKDGSEASGTEIIKTGWWLLIQRDEVDVSTYYLEIGDTVNTAGILDVEMPFPGRNPDTGDRTVPAMLLLSMGLICALMIKRMRRRKSKA